MAWRAGLWPAGRLLYTPALSCFRGIANLKFLFFFTPFDYTYACKLVTVLLKIAAVVLMGSNSAKLAPCVVAVLHLKTKPTLLSISTSYLHRQI